MENSHACKSLHHMAPYSSKVSFLLVPVFRCCYRHSSLQRPGYKCWWKFKPESKCQRLPAPCLQTWAVELLPAPRLDLAAHIQQFLLPRPLGPGSACLGPSPSERCPPKDGRLRHQLLPMRKVPSVQVP